MQHLVGGVNHVETAGQRVERPDAQRAADSVVQAEYAGEAQPGPERPDDRPVERTLLREIQEGE